MAFVVRLDDSNSVLAYEKTFDPQGMLCVQAAGKMLAIFQVKKTAANKQVYTAHEPPLYLQQ